MPENTLLTEREVLPLINALLAICCTGLSVWPNEPKWSYAAIMAFVAIGLWQTVFLDRVKRRARIGKQQTDANSDDVTLDPRFMLRFEAFFASVYTILTVIWAFVVGLWWIALAILPSLYWYNTYKHWQKSRDSRL